MTILTTILLKLYEIIAISSPYILLGFLIAGILHVTISEALFRRVFGHRGVLPILRSIGLGSLIPICSCGVVPIGVGAYKSGAGTGTVLAFMTAAPALSPASVLLSIKLLGLELAAWQVGCVAVGSFLLGLIANNLFRSYVQPVPKEELEEKPLVTLELSPQPDCCSESKDSSPEVVSLSCCSAEPTKQTEEEIPSCCSSKTEPQPATTTAPGFFSAIRKIIHWILFDFGPSVSLDMLIGLLFAATVLTMVPENMIVYLTGSKTIWSLLLVILVALPVYTCSMAAIPVVFSFMTVGMSPGAAIAFLIGGPATNFGEMNAIRNQMSWKIAAYYFVALLLLAVIAGSLVDHFVQFSIPENIAANHTHHHIENTYSWLQIASTLILFFMMSVEAKRRMARWLKIKNN